MKLKTAIVLLLVVLSATLAAAQAQNSGSLSLSLEPGRALRGGSDAVVDAWPLIAHASTPGEQRVNALLNRLNERMTNALRVCDASYRDWAKQVKQPLTGKNAVERDWNRRIAVTMTGPRFLSIVAFDFAFCGGAHPDRGTLAMVFDLTTGRPVNWMNFIAKSANASTYSDSAMDGSTVGALNVPALRPLSLAKADKDCKDIFHDLEAPQTYQLWPDAKSGTLIAEPFGLPHVAAGCADPLALTADQARKLGFDETLLSALVQAHRQSAMTH
jgi:hypothetical protein